MTAICGDTLFYEVNRILNERKEISYYQYRILTSFVELIVLHDKAVLLRGNDTDREYVNISNTLIRNITKEGFSVDIILPENRSTYINDETINLFNSICREIYGCSIGVTMDLLLKKREKDRTSEEMAEFIENIFCQKVIKGDTISYLKSVSATIYNTWEHNATSPEFLYFFRGHLFQAIAERYFLTPIFESQRLLAMELHQLRMTQNRVGTLPFVMYGLANKVFIEMSNTFVSKSDYPTPSLLMSYLISCCNTKEEIIQKLFEIRANFASFRKEYKKLEISILSNQRSLKQKNVANKEIQKHIKFLEKALSTDYDPNVVKSFFKNLWQKSGFGGDLKISFSEKDNNKATEVSETYSTQSLVKLGTDTIGSGIETGKEQILYNRNKALVDLFTNVTNDADYRNKIAKLLPIKHFNYAINKVLERFYLS